MNTTAGLFCGLLLATPVAPLGTVELNPHTVEAFNTYVSAAEKRLDAQAQSSAFLWADSVPDRQRRIKQGQILAEPISGSGDVNVPGGSIHDWVGATFIPGA